MSAGFLFSNLVPPFMRHGFVWLGLISGPYFFVMGWLLFKSKTDLEQTFERRLIFSPLVYALSLSILLFTVFTIDFTPSGEVETQTQNIRDIFQILLVVNMYVLPISYLFVGLVFGLRVILFHFGVISTDHPNKRMQSDAAEPRR